MQSPPRFLFSQEAPSPAYLLDTAGLCRNCAILNTIQERTGVRILLALKAFAAWSLFPHLSRAFEGPLYGTCASSLDEARLGRELFGGEVHVFSAGYDEASFQELLPLVDCVSFNSVAQFRRFAPLALAAKRPIHCGLRINPEHSEGTVPLYDPCHPSSRLGVRARDFDMALFAEGLSGLHCHTLCEQNADALDRTFKAVEARFGEALGRCSWLNLGGGHHITRTDYDRELLCSILLHAKRYGAELYLEPGEAVALDCGWLKATVLDVVTADMPVVILNVSVTCHMPDVLEMPYRPHVFYERAGRVCEAGEGADAGETVCRLAGNSCLAGDVIPFTYAFSEIPEVGSTLLFGDMAIYSMVKTTTFNGIRLPTIASFRDETVSIVRTFGYEDFKSRLS